MTKINNNYQYKLVYPVKKENFAKGKDGNIIIPDEYKVVVFLNKTHDFRYNLVLERLELKAISDSDWVPINDHRFNTFYLSCKAENIFVSKDYLRSLFESQYVISFHPFQDYFESLPCWDKNTDYIGQLVNTLETTDTVFTRLCIEKWLVNACRCSILPEYNNDYSPVLFGGQGVGKSRWVSSLIPKQLRPYYYNGRINLADKDALRRLATGFVIFLDEIDSYKRNEIPMLKAFITQPDVVFRKAYGTFENKLPRTSSFISATNNPLYLNDDSGNRRFLTINVLKANYNHNVDMDFVYAQVHALAKDGSYISYFTEEETKMIQEVNKAYQYKAELQLQLEDNFSIPEDGIKAVFMTATEIKQYIEFGIEGIQFDVTRIGRTMIKLGFKRVHNGSGDNKRTGYYVIKKNQTSPTENTPSRPLTKETDEDLIKQVWGSIEDPIPQT